MNHGVSIIILGAGKGTRMKSSISKPLHKIGNLEMIRHVIKSATSLDCDEISIVSSDDNYKFISDCIDNDEAKDKITISIQKERNGTGDATKVGLNAIKNKKNDILIMYGDVPLIEVETYKSMLNSLENTNSAVVVLGFNVGDVSKKYGRLIKKSGVRDELDKIIEFKDASIDERKISLCNAGILAVKGELLGKFLNEVNNNNNSGEYYLTDIIEIARKNHYKCSYIVATEEEVMGVNSREELSIAEKVFQDKKRKSFMDKGVTLIDPKTVYFSYDTKISNDVVIEPNVVMLKNVKIDSNVRIKAFSYLENCHVKEGTVIKQFSDISK